MDRTSFHCIDIIDDLEVGEWKYAWMSRLVLKVFKEIISPVLLWILREIIRMIFSTKLIKPSGTIRNKVKLWLLGLLWRCFTTLSCYGNALIIDSLIERYYPNESKTLYRYLLIISLIMFQYMIEWFVSVITDSRFEQIEKRFEQIEKRFEQIEKRFEQIEKRFELIDKRFEQIEKRFEQIEKRFEVLFHNLGIPDPANPASPELLIEIENNFNNWKNNQVDKLNQRKGKFFKDA